MMKENPTWDYELLAILSMYAEMSIGELKKLVTKLAENLQIDLPKTP